MQLWQCSVCLYHTVNTGTSCGGILSREIMCKGPIETDYRTLALVTHKQCVHPISLAVCYFLDTRRQPSAESDLYRRKSTAEYHCVKVVTKFCCVQLRPKLKCEKILFLRMQSKIHYRQNPAYSDKTV